MPQFLKYVPEVWWPLTPHPLMKLCDEPELRLQVASSFLGGDEVQQVLVLHARRIKHVTLVLPRLLVLSIHHTQLYSTLLWPHTHWTLSTSSTAREQMKQKCTWMGKIFTATCSFIIWAFQTQPKRPRALTSSSWRGFRPTSGEGGDGPGSWKHSRKTPVNHQMMPFKSTTRWSRRTTHCWDAENKRERAVRDSCETDWPRWCPRVHTEACGAGTSRRPAAAPSRASWWAAESKPACSGAAAPAEEARSLTDTNNNILLIQQYIHT